MTEIAYMTRESWAQDDTSTGSPSTAIRNWLGNPPYIFATSDLKAIHERNSPVAEFIDCITLQNNTRRIVEMTELRKLLQQGNHFNGTLTVLYPYKQEDCELLRALVERELVARLFVIVWSSSDMVCHWLDGLGAQNLDPSSAGYTLDAAQLEAAKCMVNEQYNGLSAGNGKAAVVQLIRAFTAGGYALEKEPWLRAFFAAGGKFRHAESISKLISEMQQGTKHRVQQRYRPEIFSILQERARTIQTELPE